MSHRRCLDSARQALWCRSGQSGQALIEWMLVAMLATMVAIWAAGDWAAKMEDHAAQGYAQWLNALSTGLERALRDSDAKDESMAQWRDQLPLGVPIPIEPWIKRLKQEGWLPSVLGLGSNFPYKVSLLRLDARAGCQAQACPMVILLLAEPKSGARHNTPDPVVLVSELGGRGLAVTDLFPNRLQGAAFQIENPPANGVVLPVGTVALLVWRSDQPPPYVRLNESRVVAMTGGLRLGQVMQTNVSCGPDGVVTRGPGVQLLMCQGGRWHDIKRDHDHIRACLPVSQRNAVVELLARSSGLWEILGGRIVCDCPAGFAAVDMGLGNDRIGSVVTREGYLCLRL